MSLRTRKIAGACAVLIASVQAVKANVAEDLAAAKTEAAAIAATLTKPSVASAKTRSATRRLTDAQIAYAMGDFVAASDLLLPLVDTRTDAPTDAILYYLAESLYRRGDAQTARSYFTQLASVHKSSTYFAHSLERIGEIAAQTGLADEVAIAALTAANTPNGPYIIGKYRFALGDYAAAHAAFASVPATAPLALAARYYDATTYVAEKDYATAVTLFEAVADAEATSVRDQRIKEIAALALARLYYETDVPVAASDAYLRVHRQSDLFNDALHESAWVYVKDKKFDRALKVLELLALSDNAEQMVPTVRLLEGNLRVRKAQQVREREVNGNPDPSTTPMAEYEKATTAFAVVRETYKPVHDELATLLASGQDMGVVLPEVVHGGGDRLLALSESWLRSSPGMNRVVTVEQDLGLIGKEIADTEAWIQRIEGFLASPNKGGIFGNLSESMGRIDSVRAQVAAAQIAIVEEEGRLAGGASAETETRRAAARDVNELPTLRGARDSALAKQRAVSMSVEIELTRARSRLADAEAALAAVVAQQKTPALRLAGKAELDAATAEVDSKRSEFAMQQQALDASQAAIAAAQAQDMNTIARQRQAALAAALVAEHTALVGRLPAGDKAARLRGWFDESLAVSRSLDAAVATIDQYAEEASGVVVQALAAEKTELATTKAEYLTASAALRDIGDEHLRSAARDVKAKTYEFVVGADVGLVDVAWSRKEDTDETLKSVSLNRQREMRQLRDEFRDLIEARRIKNSAPSGEPTTPPAATPAPAQPTPESGVK